MTDLNPEIWDNPTLGSAAPNENLDRLTRQQLEDRAAKFEDRDPREVVVDNTYPGWTPEVNERTGTVSSNYQTVHFADEKANDIPVDAGRPEEDASTVQDPEENDAEVPDENKTDGETDSGTEAGTTNSDEIPTEEGVHGDSESSSVEVDSPAHDSTEEGVDTQWKQ